MRIKRIELKNFKRFSDLTIADIPETSKLVLIIGSNGSGKSSLFDAFDWLNKGVRKGLPYNGSEGTEYYKKNKEREPEAIIEFADGKRIDKNGLSVNSGIDLVTKFLGRSSIRIVSRISNTANPNNVVTDQDSPSTYIENDTRFINDVFLYIQQINSAIREPIFSGRQADVLQIFKDFIEPLNQSLINIFGGDETTTIQISEFEDATPRTSAKLIFKKGQSKINYDLLSHGEKQVIILLINFIVRREYYENAIIFIDEMDCHLNTALQASLLHEIITTWIPDTAQLWTASHAIGFIDYAKKSEQASIIDFDLLNFDTKQELIPVSKEKMDVYEIAIPKSIIGSILSGYRLVVVENQNDEFYNAALSGEGYLFLPANNSREVFLTVKGDKDKLGLRDRDYLLDSELQMLRQKMPNLKILNYSTFENYIYHPANISELGLADFNVQEYIQEIVDQKNQKRDSILMELRSSRQTYAEFKDSDSGIKYSDDVTSIAEALASNEMEVFYPFFNMKKHFNRSVLAKFNLKVSDLTATKWFKEAISKILKK